MKKIWIVPALVLLLAGCAGTSTATSDTSPAPTSTAADGAEEQAPDAAAQDQNPPADLTALADDVTAAMAEPADTRLAAVVRTFTAYSAAVETQCVPQLDEAAATQIDGVWSTFDAAAQQDQPDVETVTSAAGGYVTTTSQLCN
jgi:hypothetical protein